MGNNIKMDYIVNTVNKKFFNKNIIPDSGNLNKKIKKVIVLLTASRTGSSLMKTVLSKSNNIAYLSGEEEPYYILTKNAFPWNKSDSFTKIKDKQRLLDLIFADMGINISFIDVRRTILDWQKRLSYQFPYMAIQSTDWFNDIKKNVIKYYGNSQDYEKSTKLFIENFLRKWKHYYDGFSAGADKWNESIKIEEPPFVTPSKKRSFTENDIDTHPLLFKTPQDCYRIGIFEQLFPNAEIKYIHLSRGFAQTVNGLMDGWLSDTGFFAHNINLYGTKLNIKGYSDIKKFGKSWWKFDLPYNWREFTNKKLEDVCVNQWYTAHESILESNIKAMRVKFEDFLINPQETADDICDYIGIPSIIIDKLPIIMSTDVPSLFRWRKREDLFLELSKQENIKEMMHRLCYSMNPDKWL